MITVFDEDKMVLRNYEIFTDLPSDELNHYLVDYSFSSDRKILINFYTLEQSTQYNSDVI